MYKKSQILPLIRKNLESGTTLGVSIRSAGLKSTYTVDLWRKKRPLIDRYLKVCIAKCDVRRNDAVVDSLFKQANAGNIGAIAIWLKFKMGWKDSPLIDQSQHNHKTFIYLDKKAVEENAASNRVASQLSAEQV